MTQEQSFQLQIIGSYIGKPLTEEQMEFASDFTKDTISFSDPGTGKTHTLVVGLIMAQRNHGIDGRLIDCMSFTNAAVSEMRGRYDYLCRRIGVPNTVVFNTFHRLSRQIMNEAFPTIKISGGLPLKEQLSELADYMTELGLDSSDYNYVKRVLKAINSLNSSLTFHPDNIETKYEFVQLGMEVEDFNTLRHKWFIRGIYRDVIEQGDIPLYCLYALMSKPHIIKKWKGKFKIMVVDEFQDLSLLHLRILSYIAETLIVIGDMKQQIYQFNGACPQIVEEYLKLHPDARVCNLTRSFRCSKRIAEFATSVVKPNDENVEVFTGVENEGNVQILPRRELNWEEIATKIWADIKKNTIGHARDVMFLYRNNASAIPIIEQLYKLGVPFRCSKFAMIMEVPIFDDLCTLALAAWEPDNEQFVTKALKLFPEFKYTEPGQTPGPVLVMRTYGVDIFKANYRYKDEASLEILNAMIVAKKKIDEEKNASIVLNNLLGVYEKHIIKGQWWRLDNDKEFYFNLVAPICSKKTFPLMYNEELDKSTKNNQNISANMGVRCYTIHSAKGLEADDIYLLDCDEGSFPNASVIKKKMAAGCYYDAACDIRAERNLLYVAITRAKENCFISYSADSPAILLMEPFSAKYSDFDIVYNNRTHDFDDVGEFFKLFRLGDANGRRD